MSSNSFPNNRIIIIIILFFLDSIEAFESPADCGLTAETFIIGGTDAKPSEFPFMVSLLRSSTVNTSSDEAIGQVRIGEDWQHSCGATILNNRWLLTAAHCLVDRKAENFLAIMGTIHLRELKYIYKLDKFLINGCYDDFQVIHDIALIKTDRDLPLAADPKNVGSICLPEEDSQPTEKLVYSTGWGIYEKYGINTSLILQKTKTELHSELYCLFAEQISNMGLSMGWDTSDHKLCLSSRDSSPCNGDSGGPAFEVRDGRAYQLGITSHGTGNVILDELGYRCYKFDPTLYTKVSKYIDWIDKSIEKYSDSTEKEITTEC